MENSQRSQDAIEQTRERDAKNLRYNVCIRREYIRCSFTVYFSHVLDRLLSNTWIHKADA